MMVAAGDRAAMPFTLSDVRKYLQRDFSDEELEALCFDYFPDVQAEFSAGMPKGEKVLQLLEYCLQHEQLAQLMAAIREARPEQAAERFGSAALPTDLTLEPTPEETSAGAVDEVLLERLIANQRQALRTYWLLAGGLLGAGLAVVVVSVLSASVASSPFRWGLGLGGLFVSSLSALQFREIVTRRERASIFETLRGRLEALERAPGPLDRETRRRIDHLLWQAVERTVV
jgi:Effector-associated domain 7